MRVVQKELGDDDDDDDDAKLWHLGKDQCGGVGAGGLGERDVIEV